MDKQQYLKILHDELNNYEITDIYKHISEYDLLIDNLLQEELSMEDIITQIDTPQNLAIAIANEFNYNKKIITKTNKTAQTTKSILSILTNIIGILTIIFVSIIAFLKVLFFIGLYFIFGNTFSMLSLISTLLLIISTILICILINTLRKYITQKLSHKPTKSYRKTFIGLIISLGMTIVITMMLGVIFLFTAVTNISDEDYLVAQQKLETFTSSFNFESNFEKNTQTQSVIIEEVSHEEILNNPDAVFDSFMQANNLKVDNKTTLIVGTDIPAGTYSVNFDQATYLTVTNSTQGDVNNYSTNGEIKFNNGDTIEVKGQDDAYFTVTTLN